MASQSGYDDAGSSGLGVLSSKLISRDLPSQRLLGTGLASVGYETELSGKKCARKDFIGVPSGTFRREAARLVGLEDHINVVKTLGWTEDKMSCSLVLEYMDDDLLGFLQKRKQSQGSLEAGSSSGNQSDLDSRNTIKLAPFELREALDVMLQISRGMEYLADQGIRHGNLKTKNILVTRTNDRSLSVKVSDFGLVRTRRKSTSFASRQARKLDMSRWTAPELLQVFLLEDKGETSSESDSDEERTDSADGVDSDVPEWSELGTDVYSFAVTCSQILTGEDPYPNLNWKELGVNICRHGLTPTLPAACPKKLRELLVSCLGFDQFGRLLLDRPSFSDFRRTLERLLDQNPPPPETAPMDTETPGQPMPGKSPRGVVREIDLPELITVEDLWCDRGPEWLQPKPVSGKAPTGFVREIDLEGQSIGVPQTITLALTGLSSIRADGEQYLIKEPEKLVAVDGLQDPHDRPPWMRSDETVVDVASLITSTRTVLRHRTEWTRVREELELMLPDVLRIRNRLVGYEKAEKGLRRSSPEDRYFAHMLPSKDAWFRMLGSVVSNALVIVRECQQQEDDRSHSAGGRPVTFRFLCEIQQLANQRTEAMRVLTMLLRRAQVRRAKEEAEEKAKKRQKFEL